MISTLVSPKPVRSEKCQFLPFFKKIGSKVHEIDLMARNVAHYIKLFDFLQENMTEKHKPNDPPIYISQDSEQYQNLLSASGHMQPQRSNNPHYGLGLMPRETDNISMALAVVNEC